MRVFRWVLIGVAAVVLVVAVAGGPMIHRMFTLPPINDITTDLADPPVFAVLEVPAYPERFAAEQRQAYPDLETRALTDGPAAAFERARAAVERLGWEVAAEDPAAGRIEAVATTDLMRFKDDIAIRVTATDDGGTAVDIRSRSRVGRHDFGANADRIRAFLSELERR